MTRRDFLALTSSAAVVTALPAASPEVERFFDQFYTDWVRADPESASAARIFPADEQAALDAKLTDTSDAFAHARIKPTTPCRWSTSHRPLK